MRPAAAEAPIVEEGVATPRATPRRATSGPRGEFNPTPRVEPAAPAEFDPAPPAELKPANSPAAASPVPSGGARDMPRRRGPQLGAAMAQAADYSWVQGVLERSAVDEGAWKVRYAPISVDDQYGGSFILDAPPANDVGRPGDIVYVEGEVVADAGHGRMGTGTRYRVEHIALVDHDAAPDDSSAASSAMK